MRKKTKNPYTAMKSKDVPATAHMLFLVKEDMGQKTEALGQQITEVDQRLTGSIEQLDQRVTEVETRLDRRITEVETRLSRKIDQVEERLEAKIESVATRLENKITSSMHEMKLLIEEQNARNIFVLDGLNSL